MKFKDGEEILKWRKSKHRGGNWIVDQVDLTLTDGKKNLDRNFWVNCKLIKKH